MTTATQDFPLHAGDDVTLSVPVYEADDVSLADISGATEIRWCLAETAGAVPLFEKKLSLGQITLPDGGTDGIFEVTIAKADTAGLTPGSKYHESDITIGGKEGTTMHGTVNLLPSSLV